MNKLTHIKFHAKRIYYENLIKSNSNNSFQTWSIITKIIDCKQLSKKSKLPSKLSVDNEMMNTNTQIFLDKLCDYFANIGATMSKNISNEKNFIFKIRDKSCLQSFAFQEIDEKVNFSINNIKVNSAPGSDEIPPKFVKLAKIILTPLLTKIFNKCIQHKTFPNAFKTAQVIPIPKISSLKSLNYLRPIFLLSVFSKLFEKILESRMLRFLNKNNILTPSQFGFRTNSSTELAKTTLYDKFY